MNLNLNFDKSGHVKEDYIIEGSVKKAKLNILNQYNLQNFNLNFNVNKSAYLLKQIDMKINNVRIISPLIEIKKKKIHFLLMDNF